MTPEPLSKATYELRRKVVELIKSRLTMPESLVFEELYKAKAGLRAKELAHLLSQQGIRKKDKQQKDGHIPEAASTLPDSSVRDHIKDLRLELAIFDLSREGRAQPLQIKVEKNNRDGFFLKYVDCDVHSKKFWQPYLEVGPKAKPVVVVYAEPAFYRIDGRFFIRHQDSNFDGGDAIHNAYPGLLPRDRQPSTNYVSSGEVDAAIELTRWFERRGVLTEHMTSHKWVSTGSRGRNVVLFGAPRIFPEMEELIGGRPFRYRVRGHYIECSDPSEEKPKPDPDNVDFTSRTRLVKGVMYRFRHEHSCFTLFCSNHSRFCEAAVRGLTDESAMRHFWEKQEHEQAAPPIEFELFGSAWLTAEERIVQARDISWKRIAPDQRAVSEPEIGT